MQEEYNQTQSLEETAEQGDAQEATIPEMVDAVRAGTLPRRQFMKRLTLMGLSAAGVGAIAAVATRQVATHFAAPTHTDTNAQRHLQQHDQHLQHQTQSNVDELHHDYAEHAIVEDSMHETPFVGRAAIMARKQVGMAALPGLKINVTNRVVHGDQLTVEWVATGTHSGHLPGLPASQRDFSIPGVTVVVRQRGKIVRESIYYDVAEARRQLAVL